MKKQPRPNYNGKYITNHSQISIGLKLNLDPHECSQVSAFAPSDTLSRVSKGSPRYLQNRDLSSFAMNTVRSRFSQRIDQYPKPEQQTSTDSVKDNYLCIEQILRNENTNLKDQNQLLLRQVKRLQQSNLKYKEEYKNAKMEIQAVRLQCEAHRKRADQIKSLIYNRLAELQTKVDCVSTEHRTKAQFDNSLVDLLLLSESLLN